MAAKPRKLLLVSLGALLGISLSIDHGVLATQGSSNTQIPLDNLRTFIDVFTRIKKNYVEEVSDKELLEHAIRGMLTGLDPHSAYLDTEQFTELKVGTSGEFGGLGIEVGMEDGFVKVVAPFDDTPAKKAGIQSGDLIIRLDDKPVKGMSLGDAVKIMRGKPGSDIILTVVREGVDKPFQVTVTRAIIHVNSIKSRLLEANYGYVRISQFQAKTSQDLLKAIDKLKSENKDPLKGLVLDLRNNPGGVLSAAVGVSDAFLEEGLVVYTDGRESNSRLRYNATPGDVIGGAPLVVLVNGGSASASEIVAGAIQDHKRGVIMGSKSFGKGSVQTIQDLSNGGAVKLTTARYFTPSGRSIQAEGIMPDIEIGNIQLSRREKSDVEPLKESSLQGHLENPEQKQELTGDADADKSGNTAATLIERDYELHQALSLLKGMSIFQARR